MSGCSNNQVLLVEDDPHCLALLADALRLEGFEVFEAQDGVDALETLANSSQPSWLALVTDFRMSAMHGNELIKHVLSKQIIFGEIILVSSLPPSYPEIANLLSAGNVRFFSKPHHLEAVLSLLRATRLKTATSRSGEIAV